MGAHASPTLTRSTQLWYASGQAAEGLKNEGFTLFLLFYYTQVLGLRGTLAGLAILIALLSDAVTDPLAGVLSDRLHSPWGRRHPFLYASALPVAVTFYLVFAPPAGLSQLALFAWLATFTVLTRLSMTLFHVPHLALGAELSPDYEDRTTLVTLRQMFLRIGHAATGLLGLLVFMRPTAAYPDGQLNPAAYPRLAATLSLGMFVLILTSAWRTHGRIPYLAAPDAAALRQHPLRAMLRDMWEILHHRSFRALFFGTVSAFVGWGVTVSLGLHLGTYFWRATTDQLVVWGVGMAIGLFAGLAYWPGVVRRTDKRPALVRGLVVYILFTALPPLCKLAGWWPAWGTAAYIPAFVLTTGTVAHFGIAAMMVTAESMMGDITDEDALRYGRQREGIFFGAASFAGKASFGVGSLIAGLIVDVVGLEPGVTPDNVGPDVVRNLGVTLVASMGILITGSLLFFSRYPLTRERHREIRAALDAQEAVAAS